MKKFLCVLLLFCSAIAQAQVRPLKFVADTVQIFSNGDHGATLQLKNATKDVLGFLYNKGDGITEFRQAIIVNPAPGIDSFDIDEFRFCVYPHGGALYCFEWRANITGGHISADSARYVLTNAFGDSVAFLPSKLVNAIGDGVDIFFAGIGTNGLPNIKYKINKDSVRSMISVIGPGGSYNASTGVITLTGGTGGVDNDADSLGGLPANRYVKYTDTAAMLLPYRNAINKHTDSITAHNIRIGANSTNIATNTAAILTKLNITDTAFLHGRAVLSYVINNSTDSSILTLLDGTRYAVKVGSAGGASGLNTVTGIDSTTTHFTFLNAGTSVGPAYLTVGDIINNNLGSLPPGWANTHPNNTNSFTGTKFTNSGTSNNWNNYLEADYYNYDKQRIRISFVPKTRSTNDAIGITFASNAANFSTSLRIWIDLSNGADSGRIKMNYDGGSTVAQSPLFSLAANDSCEFNVYREGQTITAQVFDRTKGRSNSLPFFTPLAFGTGGKLRLTFINGDQDVTNFYVTSWVRKNADWAIMGDSHANSGASSEDNIWPYQVFKNKTKVNVFAAPSITALTALASMLPSVLASSPKNVLFHLGYNDRRDLGSDTTTFRQRIDSIVAPLQRAGINVVLMNLVPTIQGAVQSFDTTIRNLSVTRSVKLVDDRSVLGGSTLKVNRAALDGVHLMDSGHTDIANSVRAVVSALQNGTEKDTASTLIAQDLPAGNENMDDVRADTKGNFFRYPHKRFPALFNTYGLTSSYAQPNSEAHTSGYLISDTAIIVRSFNGLNIGFSNRSANGTFTGVGTNINITGAALSTGFGQGFDDIRGQGNIVITAPSANKVFNAITSQLTAAANNNIFFNSTKGATVSGSDNTVINAYATSLSSGSSNIGIGANALRGVTTAGTNIHLTTRNSSAQSMPNIPDVFLFGDVGSSAGDPYVSGDIAFVPYQYGSGANLLIGGRVAGGSLDYGIGFGANTGTNQRGNLAYIRASKGTGATESGKLLYMYTDPVAAGSTLQSTSKMSQLFERLGVTLGNATTLTRAPDAILDLQITTKVMLPPRVTSAQRDLIPTGLLAVNNGAIGSAYTNGTVPITPSGGTCSVTPIVVVTIAGGVIQPATIQIIERGACSVVPTSWSVTSGAGSGATFTATFGATVGGIIVCTDCTANNGHTGVLQMWSGPTNGWENLY